MWYLSVLLLLAGVVIAEKNGWDPDKEYIFEIKSRTMAVLYPSEDQYTGILIQGQLKIQPKNSDTLMANLIDAKYSQVHTKLPEGWDSKIPDDQLKLEDLPISGKPFEIKLQHGVVKDLNVNKNVPTWEVNILKSIVSQLQIDTQGKNSKSSKQNLESEGNQSSAMFKTMEDSVGGKCEVLYNISPLPENIWNGNQELVPMPELRGDKDFIEIIKTKNYTNCEQRMIYHSGMIGMNNFEPGSNDNGKFLSKLSISRIVISGDVESFTIQSSETTNKVILNSGSSFQDQRGLVASKMSLSLRQVNAITEKMLMPSNLQATGNLVYNFNSPFSDSKMDNNNNKSADSQDDREFWQPKLGLDEAPETPLLPYFIGNRGNSLQRDGLIDPVQKAKDLSNEIGIELKKPSDLLEEETLEKFLMLTRLIRIMNSKQIEKALEDLFESSNHTYSDDKSSLRRNSWAAFRDALAQAGTGPALVNIKKMIENKNIEGLEAAQLISSTSKATFTPNPEYLELFFKLVTMKEIENQAFLRESAILSFADLIRNSIVDRRLSHNLYPVHNYGRLFTSENATLLLNKYISHLSREFQAAMEKGDSPKIQTLILALGKIGHPKILGAFEPFLEGVKPSSKYQRLMMVLTMSYMTRTYPTVARSVSYRIFANTGENYEIRCAAVRVLMKTNPPAEMLQRMAESTNHDENKNVNSAVKSAIESAAELTGDQNEELANNAQAARNFLSPENYDDKFSRNWVKILREKEPRIKFQTSYIGSEDSPIPKELFWSLQRTYGGLKKPSIQGGTMVSSIQDLLDYLEKTWLSGEDTKDSNDENDSDNKKSNWSADKIAQLMKIEADDPKQIEGYTFLDSLLVSQFIPFDNHTLDHIPKLIQQVTESLKKGRFFNLNKFVTDERILSFPTETGFPFIYTLRTPSLIKLEGNAKISKEIASALELRFVYSTKIQEQIGFLTPFESKHYIAGEDKNFQIFLPIRVEAALDIANNELRLKIQQLEKKESYKILQSAELPYTSKYDILSMKPVLKDSENTRIIQNPEYDKETIDLFYVVIEYEQDESIENQGWFTPITSLWYKSRSSLKKLSLKINPDSDSSDASIKIGISYDSKRKLKNKKNEPDGSSDKIVQAKAPYPSDRKLNSKDRRNEFLNDVSNGIESAISSVVDMSLELTGEVSLGFSLTAALACSNIDEKSRALFYLNAIEDSDISFEVCAALETKIPNAPELNLEDILKSNLTNEFDADIHIGQECSSGGKIKIQGEMKQTNELKKQVRETSSAKLYEGDNEEKRIRDRTGSYKKLMLRAAKLDQTEISIQFNEMAYFAREFAIMLLNLIADNLDNINIDTLNPKNKDKNKIDIKIQTTSEDGADVSVYAPNMDLEMKTITLENTLDISKESSETAGEEYLFDIKSSCFMGKKFVGTFDNHMLAYELGNCWHVILTTFPKEDPDRPSEDLPMTKDMKTAILAREIKDGEKELMIVLDQREIILKNSSSHMEITLDGKKIEISKRKSLQEISNEKDLEGYELSSFEIFELPDASIKIISELNELDVVFDGRHIKITVGDKYYNSIRGLCGNFDGESFNDQKAPRNCLLKNPKEFAASWALTQGQCEGSALNFTESAKKAHCSRDKNLPRVVVAEKENSAELQQQQQKDIAEAGGDEMSDNE